MSLECCDFGSTFGAMRLLSVLVFRRWSLSLVLLGCRRTVNRDVGRSDARAITLRCIKTPFRVANSRRELC
jgi:hypothetical protein